MKKPVYLDYQATTPVDPRVFEAMKPYFTEHFGNPGSRTHDYGEYAEQAVESARQEVAALINAEKSSEIVFTSGATESNNIAIQGIAFTMRAKGKDHIITSEIEHKAVLDICHSLEEKGFCVTYLKPTSIGEVNLAELEAAITAQTGLISLMHVNNEIGVINLVTEIGKIAKKHNILFHCDAAQSFGKIAVDMKEMNIHLLSISGHKIYGPKGIGALYVRKQNPKIEIEAILFGGGQEKGLRPGTLAAPLIVGLGEAAKIAKAEIKKDLAHVQKLRDQLMTELKRKCDDISFNSPMESRLPHNLNVCFKGVDSEALMLNLRSDISVSNGSACTSANWTTSHVLKALGQDEDTARSAVRFGFGRFTSAEEIDFAVDCISKTVIRLRQMTTGSAI